MVHKITSAVTSSNEDAIAALEREEEIKRANEWAWEMSQKDRKVDEDK